MTVLVKPVMTKLIPALFLLFISAVFAASGHGDDGTAPSLQNATVIAVNDGDTVTLLLGGKRHRARLIGIDAPEMGQEPWGQMSREHLRKLLKGYRWRISVESGIEQRDKYNRLLVYLWSPDGQMLNERMLLDGYAVLFTIQPNSKYSERFRKAQRIARENRSGIWGKDGLREKPLDYKRAHPRMSNVMFREKLHSPYLLSSRCPDRSGPAQAAL
jgi:micrococcal nuclease